MKLRKKSLMITLVDEATFHVSIRVWIFGVFPKWVELTSSVTENGDEQPIEFKTLDEAVTFINLIAK